MLVNTSGLFREFGHQVAGHGMRIVVFQSAS